MLDHWVAYHRVLLAFYHHHRQRCVLMHARQASQLMDPHWQQLQSLLDMPPLETAPPPAQPASTSHRDRTVQPLAETLAQLDSANKEHLNLLTGRTIESYLIADLLATHPASAQLYEELQATANVPWDAERPERPEAAQAWQGLLQQRQQLNALFGQLIDEKNNLNQQLQQEKDAGAKAQPELKFQLEQHQTHNIKELEEENELLLLQLHQVQEELERYFLENQELKSGKAVSSPASKVPQRAYGTHYGAGERIKRQLTYRLGAIMVSHSHKPADWLRIPGALLREVRQFKREAPERAAQKLPPIDTYADAYEAERVKRHLSYRLGVVLMSHSRSPKGWLTMPWAMHKAVHEFRADRQQVGK